MHRVALNSECVYLKIRGFGVFTRDAPPQQKARCSGGGAAPKQPSAVWVDPPPLLLVLSFEITLADTWLLPGEGCECPEILKSNHFIFWKKKARREADNLFPSKIPKR